jgi:hypothetical protein
MTCDAENGRLKAMRTILGSYVTVAVTDDHLEDRRLDGTASTGYNGRVNCQADRYPLLLQALVSNKAN